MIHPSYAELMAVVNSDVKEGEEPIVESRYSIVKATAQRAKQIIDSRHIQEKIDKSPDPDDINSIITSDEKRRLKIGEPMLVNVDNVKPLSIAVKEVNEGLVKILPADKTADEE